LRQVAAKLGIALDESDPGWHRLEFRALRVMVDTEQETPDATDLDEGLLSLLQAPSGSTTNGLQRADRCQVTMKKNLVTRSPSG